MVIQYNIALPYFV